MPLLEGPQERSGLGEKWCWKDGGDDPSTAKENQRGSGIPLGISQNDEVTAIGIIKHLGDFGNSFSNTFVCLCFGLCLPYFLSSWNLHLHCSWRKLTEQRGQEYEKVTYNLCLWIICSTITFIQQQDTLPHSQIPSLSPPDQTLCGWLTAFDRMRASQGFGIGSERRPQSY